MTPARIVNPSTPAGIGGWQPAATPGDYSSELQPFKKLSIFTDGTETLLRHVARRKRGTGEQLAIPKIAVRMPESWRNRVLIPAGSKKKLKATKDPIPSFDSWRKTRRKQPKLAGVTPAEPPYSPIPPDAAKASKNEEMTPAFADITPFETGQGETPGLPPGETPRMPGVATPGFGAETPFPFGGEETPGVPRTPADGEQWSKGEATPMLPGDQTPHGVPMLPGRADLKSKKDGGTPGAGAVTPLPGEETPGMPPLVGSHGDVYSKEEAVTPGPGAETPGYGEETPAMPREGDATPMLPPGMQTPMVTLPRAGLLMRMADSPATPNDALPATPRNSSRRPEIEEL